MIFKNHKSHSISSRKHEEIIISDNDIYEIIINENNNNSNCVMHLII